jgi:hypothetical protein
VPTEVETTGKLCCRITFTNCPEVCRKIGRGEVGCDTSTTPEVTGESDRLDTLNTLACLDTLFDSNEIWRETKGGD